MNYGMLNETLILSRLFLKQHQPQNASLYGDLTESSTFASSF